MEPSEPMKQVTDNYRAMWQLVWGKQMTEGERAKMRAGLAAGKTAAESYSEATGREP